MNIGMLWYDDSKTSTLAEKVTHAAEYYAKKNGAVPTVCFVNPSALAAPEIVAGLSVRPWKSILLNHFWLGIEESESVIK